MNQKLGMIGSVINCVSVVLFALFMLIHFSFGGYFICMILAFGFIMMMAAFYTECEADRKVAGTIGILFAAIYAVFILQVYFAQTTSIRLDNLDGQALKVLDYKQNGLYFYYDLLGYGIMALATFFMGLTIKEKNKQDKWLKWLLIIHGIFFVSCFFMPMLGVLSNSTTSDTGYMAGVIALEFWCVYFIPIGVLSYLHFKNK